MKLMRKLMLWSFFALWLLASSNVDGALINRGGGLIYDDVLNVTWTQNAGLALSVNTPGADKWTPFLNWADTLVYAGYDDWRLASMDVNGDQIIVQCGSANEVECRDNEYAYMYYFNLGGNPFEDKSGDQTAVNGVAVDDVWRAYRFGSFDFFDFRFGFANQGQFASATVWAVRDGDSAQVPEPASALLLGIATLVLLRRVLARR